VFHHTTAQRQERLYQQRGFDEDRWAELVADSKKLGREIRRIAEEYGVKWDPKKEAMGRAEGILEKEDRMDRKAGKGREKQDDDEEEED
jgi:calcium uniporter protein, mitochondrial